MSSGNNSGCLGYKGDRNTLHYIPRLWNKLLKIKDPIIIQPRHMGVSKNRSTPKSSILIGFSLINHPFWGTTIFGNTHIYKNSTYISLDVSFDNNCGKWKLFTGPPSLGLWQHPGDCYWEVYPKPLRRLTMSWPSEQKGESDGCECRRESYDPGVFDTYCWYQCIDAVSCRLFYPWQPSDTFRFP